MNVEWLRGRTKRKTRGTKSEQEWSPERRLREARAKSARGAGVQGRCRERAGNCGAKQRQGEIGGRTNIHAEVAKILFVAPLRSGQQPRQTSIKNGTSKNDSWRELTWLGLTAIRISVMSKRKLEREFGNGGLGGGLSGGLSGGPSGCRYLGGLWLAQGSPVKTWSAHDALLG